MNLNPEFVPFGDSKQFCINFAWTSIQQWRIKSSYEEFKGLPECTEAKNPKFRWQINDPKNGVDIIIWKQNIEDIHCSSLITCKLACPGVYKPGLDDDIATGKCYTYDVLKAICLEVGLELDPETGQEKWDYKGGCFEKDSPTLFEGAVPGTTYSFDYIPIEVRADDDPFTIASKSGVLNQENGIDLSYFGWLSWLAFSLALIAALVLVASVGAFKFVN
jgi:hypothetical protein